MIRPQTIDRAIDIIVAQCEPEQIFVIGSVRRRHRQADE